MTEGVIVVVFGSACMMCLALFVVASSLINAIDRLTEAVAQRQDHGGDGSRSRFAKNRRNLRRLLLEMMAGPKEPGARYARMHKTRLGEHAVWIR